jgi:hypothetical protein
MPMAMSTRAVPERPAPRRQGSFTGTDGYIYVGQWTEGRIEGRAASPIPTGRSTRASSDDLAHGTGRIVYPDGNTYEGEWVAGVIEGEGRATYANGLVYEGGFKDAKNHGFGVMTYPDGYRYEGDWVEGRRQGQGTATYADGTVYVGGSSTASARARAPSPCPRASPIPANGRTARSTGWASRPMPMATSTRACS